ncbi:MAG TPA: beta-galactosidase small subunit [Lachnospiraceae bacterium]|nr:beta-galactosidase small subunit [Lachnospiraceae bacterium]
MDCTNKLRVIYGDSTLGVHGVTALGSSFSYIFNYACGGMESLVIGEKEWLYRVPKPTFWRALTDNDRGNKFHFRCGMWLTADMYIKCKGADVKVEGNDIPFPIGPENNKYSNHETAEKISITFTYETCTIPTTIVTVTYEVVAGGKIKVETFFKGNQELPQLPVFGLRFLMPTAADGYEYEGLSGETYPDRMAGGIPGVYQIKGMPVTKYLVPQECGMHMNTKWVTVTRSATLNNVDQGKTPFSLKFSADSENFAFSCLPYTAEELENATHQEELPPVRRTVLGIFGAVRGVGGMDSWWADVEKAYQIDADKDICFSFTIEGV